MPYIPKKNRKKYDPFIDSLAQLLNNTTNNDELSGDMNYVLFRLARLLCNKDSEAKHGKRGQHNYARMAVVRSAMREAHDEFHRREMIPYEIGKIESNGDVEL